MPTLSAYGHFINLNSPGSWKNTQQEDSDCDTSASDDENERTPQDFQVLSLPLPYTKTFREFTGLTGPIFSADLTSNTPALWANKNDNDAVYSFVETFLTLPESEQILFIRKKKDSHSKGRDLYLSFMKDEKGFNFASTTRAIMCEMGVDPYTTAKVLGVDEVASFSDSQVHTSYKKQAEVFFGHEVFIKDLIQAPALKFIKSLSLLSWQKQRVGVKKEMDNIEALDIEVQNGWNELVQKAEQPEGALISIDDVQKWLRLVQDLTTRLRKVGDQKSIQSLKELRKKLKEMMASLVPGGKAGKRKTDAFPKALKEALKLLADHKMVGLLTYQLLEQLEASDPDLDDFVPEFLLRDPSHDHDVAKSIQRDWTEGVEEYQKWSDVQILTALGVKTTIPFLMAVQDPNGLHDPWKEPDWFEIPDNVIPFIPRWHQLVGILKGVKNAMTGIPLLQADDVGLGKTLQIAGVISTLAYYREHHDLKKAFPGSFASDKWKGKSDNIPDFPNLIVVPVSLVNQVVSELHRYYQFGSFDILPYLGKWEGRKNWWRDHWMKCQNKLGRRIVVTTPTAMESDFSAVMILPQDGSESPTKKSSFSELAQTTLYGTSWTVTAFDEAHNYRNAGRTFWAAYSLRNLSEFTVAISATPVVSRPQDIFNLGKMLGIAEFDGPKAYSVYCEMEKKLRSATAKDRNWVKKHGDDKSTLIAAEKDGGHQSTGKFQKEMRRYVEIFRKAFQGAVVRRSLLQSVDNTGARVSGLEPYKEDFLRVDLYPHEMENLEKVASNMAKGRQGKNPASFYLPIRRALAHPTMKEGSTWTTLNTLAAWEQNPSKKVDIVVEGIKYHLLSDHQQPLKIENNRVGLPTPTSSIELEAQDLQVPDKIVIFSNFRSTLDLIKNVLELHGISSLLLHGGLDPDERKEVVNKFQLTDRDGERVLLMSQVASVGINLPCANILFIFDILWSAQHVNQLIGRLWRYPQMKTVIVYTVVANNTDDVYLNNHAFKKAEMHHAFRNTTPSMRSLFEEGQDDDGHFEMDSEEEATGTKRKRKAGGESSRGNLKKKNVIHGPGGDSGEPRKAKGKGKRKPESNEDGEEMPPKKKKTTAEAPVENVGGEGTESTAYKIKMLGLGQKHQEPSLPTELD